MLKIDSGKTKISGSGFWIWRPGPDLDKSGKNPGPEKIRPAQKNLDSGPGSGKTRSGSRSTAGL
jgi:hypothetical protein